MLWQGNRKVEENVRFGKFGFETEAQLSFAILECQHSQFLLESEFDIDNTMLGSNKGPPAPKFLGCGLLLFVINLNRQSYVQVLIRTLVIRQSFMAVESTSILLIIIYDVYFFIIGIQISVILSGVNSLNPKRQKHIIKYCCEREELEDLEMGTPVHLCKGWPPCQLSLQPHHFQSFTIF